MALKIFEDRRHVFWQAFFLTLLFFFLGLILGVYLEQIRADNSNVAFYKSETSLYDSFALGKLLENSEVSCEDLKSASVDFADKIYLEAKELERYEGSSKLTDSLKTIHQKYDLLRTLLWMNIISIKERCGNVNTVVYLYQYDTEDLQIKSEQSVWGKVLNDVKNEKGSDLILIPIAADQNIISLDYLLKSYDVKEYPAVIINEKTIIYDLKSSSEIISKLD